MNNKITKMLAVLLIVGFASNSAFAENNKRKKKDFKEKHPRRAEVIGRANNEEKKNEAAETSGKITQGQENKLNRQDQRIKREEQRDAKINGGYITKGQQEHLNKEENHVNAERNNMEKRDAAKAPSTTPVTPSTPATPVTPATGN